MTGLLPPRSSRSSDLTCKVPARLELSAWIAARTERLRPLGAVQVRGLTPSLRDFVQAVSTGRSALAVIVELSRGVGLELEAFCQSASDAQVSALAAVTEPILHGGDEALLAEAARAFDGPVLMSDLVVSREQLYGARLLGADAVLLTAAALHPSELRACIDIAASMHMATPVLVAKAAELTAAVAAGARVVVLPADVEGALLPAVPRTVVAIVRGPFSTPAELLPLRGRADALWVTGPAPAGLPAFVSAAEGT